jgi:hypothetical protein
MDEIAIDRDIKKLEILNKKVKHIIYNNKTKLTNVLRYNS